MAVREVYVATVESGSVTDSARLELPDMHLWLYPEEDGTVRVETEAKSIHEMLG